MYTFCAYFGVCSVAGSPTIVLVNSSLGTCKLVRDNRAFIWPTALCTRNAHITLYDVTTWSLVNLVNPISWPGCEAKHHTSLVSQQFFFVPSGSRDRGKIILAASTGNKKYDWLVRLRSYTHSCTFSATQI